MAKPDIALAIILRAMRQLSSERWGAGEPVVLVHGGVLAGEASWRLQRPLADRWQLVVVDRAGYGDSPPRGSGGPEADADDVAPLLGERAHLVGHSYGGLVAMLAAARRPHAVASLAMIEPAAFQLARGDPDVDRATSAFDDFFASAPSEPDAFLRGFMRLVGNTPPLPDPLPERLEQAARAMMADPGTGGVRVPVDELARAPFPKLVFSGDHSPAFERVCDVLEQRLGAERAVIPGAGHAVQLNGKPFNDRLAAFLAAAT